MDPVPVSCVYAFQYSIIITRSGALVDSRGTAPRVREGGEVTHRVPTGRMAIACMLGGTDGRTLFVLTSESVHPEECEKLRSARIERLEVEVPGAGLP